MRLGILAVLLFVASASGQVCSKDAERSSLAEVRAQQARLFDIPELKDDLPYDPPQEARTGVPGLMNALSAAVERSMLCDANTSASPFEIEHRLIVMLGANRPLSASEKRNSYPYHTYGDALSVHVNSMLGRPEMLAVDVSFAVACGENHMLLLFRRTPWAWKKELDWHSGTYAKPSDAFGDFFLYSLAPGSGERPLVAVAYGTPWCSSRMSAFHIDLLRLADESTPQALLAHRDEFYSRFEHMPTALKQTADGVQIRVWYDSLDFDDLFIRPRIYRFLTTGNKLERVQPIADNARDFVDAWLQAPWSESQKWVEQPGASLQRVRDRFDYSLNKNLPQVEFGAVRRCSSGAHLFQVEMRLSEFVKDGTETGSRDLPELFAKVRQNANSFTMISMDEKSDPGCKAADLMQN